MNQSHSNLLPFLALAIFGAVHCAQGQGSFTNMDFESAQIPSGTQPSTVPASEAIPGWTANSVTAYDTWSLGGQAVSIIDSMVGIQLHNVPIQGNYSVVLFAGPDGGAADSSSISQTGLVPAGTQSIDMDIALPYGTAYAGTGFTVSLGGQSVGMVPVQTFSTYTVYGGNIPSAMAGQSEQLTITEYPPAPPTVPPSALAVDDIVFSEQLAPEPSSWVLFLTGAALFGIARFRRQRR